MRDAEFYVNKRLQPPKSFFDWCYSQIPTIIFSNKDKVISSNRKGCKVIRKRLNKNTRTDFDDCYKCFAITLCTLKRIEIQSYGFYSRYNRGIQDIKCELVMMNTFNAAKTIL